MKNKSLRQKSGHPAGLQSQNQKEFVQTKVRESRGEMESLKGVKGLRNEDPQQRKKSHDQTPKAKVSD